MALCFFLKKKFIHSQIKQNRQQMNISQQQDKKNNSSFCYISNLKNRLNLFLKKSWVENSEMELGELAICNINDLKDDDFKILIQNFFENDRDDDFYNPKLSTNGGFFCEFTFGCKSYKVYVFGEE